MNYGMDYQTTGGGGGGFSTTNSSPQNQNRRRSYDEQTLQPITVRMALSASKTDDDNTLSLVDGRQLYHVQLVGAIKAISDHSTNILYEIEDGTGLIEVKKWIDTSMPDPNQHHNTKPLVEHMYVKVVGQIKDYDGKKMIVAESVRPLSTGNELTHHCLRVVYESEKALRESQYVAAAPLMGGGTMHSAGVGFGGSGTPLVSNTVGSGDSVQEAVSDFFRVQGEASQLGAAVSQCIHSFAGKFTEQQIRHAVSILSSEGNIYSTIDDEHFKHSGM